MSLSDGFSSFFHRRNKCDGCKYFNNIKPFCRFWLAQLPPGDGCGLFKCCCVMIVRRGCFLVHISPCVLAGGMSPGCGYLSRWQARGISDWFGEGRNFPVYGGFRGWESPGSSAIFGFLSLIFAGYVGTHLKTPILKVSKDISKSILKICW